MDRLSSQRKQVPCQRLRQFPGHWRYHQGQDRQLLQGITTRPEGQLYQGVVLQAGMLLCQGVVLNQDRQPLQGRQM